MKYWLISLPREDMEHCIKVGVFGMNKKGSLGAVKEDDGIVCYVTKERKIIGLGKVTEPYYMDDSKIFLKDGLFPDRINIAFKKLTNDVDFIQLLDQFEFITNIAYWSVYLRSGFTQITKKDWELINKAAASLQST